MNFMLRYTVNNKVISHESNVYDVNFHLLVDYQKFLFCLIQPFIWGLKVTINYHLVRINLSIV